MEKLKQQLEQARDMQQQMQQALEKLQQESKSNNVAQQNNLTRLNECYEELCAQFKNSTEKANVLTKTLENLQKQLDNNEVDVENIQQTLSRTEKELQQNQRELNEKMLKIQQNVKQISSENIGVTQLTSPPQAAEYKIENIHSMTHQAAGNISRRDSIIVNAGIFVPANRQPPLPTQTISQQPQV